MKLSTPELEAEIHYLKESEGGRSTGVRSGYRGQFHYNGKDWDAFQQFLDKEMCQPGETVKVHLQTASADFHVGKMKIGQEFEIREGARIVGKGKITKILRGDFNYWDYSTFLEFLAKDVKPYSESDDLRKFRQNMESHLRNIGFIDEIEFEPSSNSTCLIAIKCKLGKEYISPREIAYNILERLKSHFSTSNYLYKIEMDNSFNNYTDKLEMRELKLNFAVWDSRYLSGQVILTK